MGIDPSGALRKSWWWFFNDDWSRDSQGWGKAVQTLWEHLHMEIYWLGEWRIEKESLWDFRGLQKRRKTSAAWLVVAKKQNWKYHSCLLILVLNVFSFLSHHWDWFLSLEQQEFWFDQVAEKPCQLHHHLHHHLRRRQSWEMSHEEHCWVLQLVGLN